MTKRWIWLAVAVSLAAGCKKDKTDATPDKGKTAEAGGGGGGTTATGSGTAQDTTSKTPMPAVNLPAGVDRLLAAIPTDAEIVVGVDLGKLVHNPLLGPLFDEAMKQNTGQMGFDPKAECGIDPMASLGEMVLGVKMESSDSGTVSVALGGIDKAKMLPCLEKARPKIEAKGAKLEIDGDYVHITSMQDGKEAHFGMAFGSDNVAAVRISKTAPDKAAVMQMAAAKAGDGLTASSEFMTMVGQTNTSATIWGLANGGSPMMSRGPVKFQSAFGSIEIGDGVTAEGRIKFKSPDDAQKVAKTFGGQLASVKQMGFADVAELTPDGSDVKFTFAMKKQQVENLKTMMMSVMKRGGGAGGPNMGGPGGAQINPPPPPPKSGP